MLDHLKYFDELQLFWLVIAAEKQDLVNSLNGMFLGLSTNFVIAVPVDSQACALYVIFDLGKDPEKIITEYGFWDGLNGLRVIFSQKYNLQKTKLTAIFLVVYNNLHINVIYDHKI